jgi:flagellar biosynthesis protein FliQ
MDTSLIKDIMVQAMWITTLISLPILGASLIVGLIISILQATTSIQEQTLSFVPKLIAIVLAIVIFGGWMTGSLMDFTQQVFDLIPNMALPTP